MIMTSPESVNEGTNKALVYFCYIETYALIHVIIPLSILKKSKPLRKSVWNNLIKESFSTLSIRINSL